MSFTDGMQNAFELFLAIEESNTNGDVVYHLEIDRLSIEFRKIYIRGDKESWSVIAKEWIPGEVDALIAAMEKELAYVG